MTIDIAKNGERSAQHEGIRIHSAYNPRKEACRFLDSVLPAETIPRSVVIVGAGLGYADKAAADRWPNADIIAIHLNSKLHENRIDGSKKNLANRIKRWYPESGVSLASFLASAIREQTVRGLQIFEWPAATAVMPQKADEAIRCLSEVIRRHTGSISATAAFGRSWIKNTLRNFIELDRLVIPSATDDPIVLAASGPSLEYALPYLSKNRDRFRLWALPSALPALISASLIPDLIFTTDSGHWARLHMRFFPPSVPVAMPLSAAPLPCGIGIPLLIRQGIPGESCLLDSTDWSLPVVPARGTVAATALEIWRTTARGSLLLAGLDLCWRDLKSHAAPHAFDGWIASRVDRRNPLINELWNRARTQAPKRQGKRRTGAALETYADWFRSLDGKGRIFRFRSPNDSIDPVPIEGFPVRGPEIFNKWKLLKKNIQTDKYSIIEAPQKRRVRHDAVIHLLDVWKERLAQRTTSDSDDDDFDEMLYTLDPGGALDLNGALEAEKERITEEHYSRVEDILNKLRNPYVR